MHIPYLVAPSASFPFSLTIWMAWSFQSFSVNVVGLSTNIVQTETIEERRTTRLTFFPYARTDSRMLSVPFFAGSMISAGSSAS